MGDGLPGGRETGIVMFLLPALGAAGMDVRIGDKPLGALSGRLQGSI